MKAPNYRSRPVAKEINTCKRLVLSAATRAFFHAKVKREVYVDLPNENKLHGDEISVQIRSIRCMEPGTQL